MHQHRQHLLALRVGAAVHARAHRTLNDRVDDLQMRRVKGQRQMHRAARGADVRAKALVVFHVTRREFFGRGMVKLGKQVFGLLAHGVDQHVQAPAVGHTDHNLLHALRTSGLDQLVHRSDKALAALQREALLADVLGVQKALQALSGSQAAQDVLFFLGIEIGFAAHAL